MATQHPTTLRLYHLLHTGELQFCFVYIGAGERRIFAAWFSDVDALCCYVTA
jgi:hypothetical protein